MASVKFGAVVPIGVGKLGGHCFFRIRGGIAMRTNANSNGRHFFADIKVQQAFQTIRERWAQLPNSEKSKWQSLGERFPVTNWYGQTMYLTGAEFFYKVNVIRYYSGDTSVLSADNYDNFQPLMILDRAIFQINDDLIAIKYDPPSANYDLQVYAAHTAQDTDQYSNLTFYFMGIYSGNNIVNAPIGEAITAQFGFVPISSSLFIQVRIITESGILGVPLITKSILFA